MAGESMSSVNFVAEVLANAGRLEKEDLNSKLGKLSKKIKQVKEELYESLRAVYVDSDPCFDMSTSFYERVQSMKEEIQSLENKIDKDIKGQLDMSATEFQDLSSQLADSTCLLLVLERIVQVKNGLDNAKEACALKQFKTASENLAKIDSLLASPLGSRDSDILIFKSLRKAHLQLMEKLISDTQDYWRQHFRWHLPKKDAECHVVEISLPSKNAEQQILQETAQTMLHCNILQNRLQTLGRRLVDYVVTPILERSSVKVLCVTSGSGTSTLTVNQGKPGSKPAAFLEVTFNLESALRFLYDNILKYTVTVGDKTVTLSELLGEQIGDEMTELFITKCLSRFIPSSRAELQTFNKIKRLAEQYQKFNHDIFFIPSSNTAISKYLSNVDSLFANKKSQEILTKARNLMTSDLHNSIKISPKDVMEIPPPGHLFKEQKQGTNISISGGMLINKKMLNVNTLQFPTCMVSIAIRDLMGLVYETLEEALQCSPDCAKQLYYVSKLIFHLYLSVVPTYHKESLATLPQLAALHHNNCMYIAHHLVTLGHQFNKDQPKAQDSNVTVVEDTNIFGDRILTFEDLILSIRRLGVECFLQMMTLQKNQMLEFLSASQGFQGVSEMSQFQNVERAIKQALYQLHRLSNIWTDVLPIAVYNRSMGTLIRSLMGEIVSGITSLEDISADDATLLHTLTQSVVETAPGLLLPSQEGSEISLVELHQNIANWTRFQELQKLLNANLQEIADRWADGKGPLAAEFSSSEVKQLIRALFQNTDRRAAVLAKIC